MFRLYLPQLLCFLLVLRLLTRRTRANKAQIPARLPVSRSQVPSDFFHLRLSGQSLVCVERAHAHGEMDFSLDIESPAEYFLFRRAKPGDDVAIGATAAQRLTPLRSSSFYGYFDHDIPFSKKRNALRLCLGVGAHITDRMWGACKTTRRRGSRAADPSMFVSSADGEEG